MDLGLLQKDVAERIGVSRDTFRNWEAGRTEPAVQHVPRIVGFLGPFTLPEAERALDFPARLTLARRRLGLTQKQFAARLGVDESTVQKWETGQHRPIRRHRERLQALLTSLTDSWRR